MADRFESLEHLTAKIEWEGGIAETASYGVKPSEMPEGNPQLEKLWAELCEAQNAVEDLEHQIQEILEPHGLA